MAAQGEVDFDEAKRWLKKAPHKDIQALGAMEDPPEALKRPVQAALQFLGDNDISWENCRESLAEGRRFANELCMFPPTRVTRRNLEKIESVEASAKSVLCEKTQDGLYSALAICIFVESAIITAKTRFGVPVASVPQPILAGFSLTDPRAVQFRQLMPAMEEACEMFRTPLFVCNGKEDLITTFFSYMCATFIDARQVLNEVLVKKVVSVEDMREQIRRKIVSALKFGKPLQIRLSNTAMDWNVYCGGETGLPEALFNAGLWKMQEVWSGIMKPEEMEGGCMNLTSHFVFITSDFDLAKVREHLPSKLPLFDSLAIIDIDPNSIASS